MLPVLAAISLGYAALGAICLADPRSQRVGGWQIAPRKRLLLRIAGALAITIATAALSYFYGDVGMAIVALVCLLALADIALIVQLSFRPATIARGALAMGGTGLLLLLLSR